MSKKLTVFFLSMVFCLSAFGASWSVQVTYPDYEVKNFNLDDMEHKLLLPKTSWRCWVGATEFNKKQELKKLRCHYSIEKLGEFTQILSCGNALKFSERVVDLKDERKNLDFKIHLICRVKS